MATQTTNLGLVKPDYTDAADIAVINTNMDTIDAQERKLSDGLCYVVNGNTSIESATIPVGKYVRLVNSTIAGRSDGIYTVKTAIPVAPATIDNTYLNETAPIAGGVANDLNSKIRHLPVLSGNVTFYTSFTNNQLYGFYRSFIYGNFANRTVTLVSVRAFDASGNEISGVSGGAQKINESQIQVDSSSSVGGCFAIVVLSFS